MKPIRVLVVDDMCEIRELAEIYWRSEPIELVAWCTTGSRALLYARDRKPDLVVTDVWLKDMSGFRLIELLRRQNPEMKIIVTSIEPHSRATQAGMDAFIFKEELFDKLPEVIRDLFRDRFKSEYAHAEMVSR